MTRSLTPAGRRTGLPYRMRLGLTRALIYAFVLLIGVACVLPFYVMLINCTRSTQEISAGFSLLPGDSLVRNFETLILGKVDPVTGARGEGWNVFQGLGNSAIIALSSTLLAGYFCALCAYGFAMYRFRGRRLLWGILMAVMMIPATVSLIGVYKLCAGLGMVDTWWPLILPPIANSFGVFFLRQYIYGSVPLSLIESARMDGASEVGTFHRISLPLMMPGIATIAILGFIGSWTSFLLPLIILNRQELFTMPILISRLNPGTYTRDLGAVYAGITVSVIPVLAMFALFSRQLVDGISAGGVKE